jgi:protease PrsW
LIFLIFMGAALPSFMLVYIIYKIDDFKEPLPKMLSAFILGTLSPLITLQLSHLFNLHVTEAEHPWIYALSMAAMPEEIGRFLILLWVTYRWRDVGEPFDCIVYGAAIWGGFSATENALYAMSEIVDHHDPFWLLSTRATLCTLGHISWGVIMGAYIGISRFGAERSLKWAARGLLIVITLHMVYDGLLMSSTSSNRVIHFISAIGVDAFSIVLSLLFIIRMEKIQYIAHDDGHRTALQSDLLKRHRPDQLMGVYEIVTHMGITGVLTVFAAMVLTSSMVMYIFKMILSGDSTHILSIALLGFLALLSWRAVLKFTVVIEEETASALDREIEEIIG